jgi:hypothetical protein
MISAKQAKVGIEAGILAGAVLAVVFFLLDLARLQPMSTPLALSARLLGPNNPAFDLPVVSQLLSMALFAGNLLTFTIFHFLTFALLGVFAVWGCEECRIPLNLGTGAIYGLVAGTLAFYGCVALCGDHVLSAAPGPGAIALANLASGIVMGGWVQASRARAPRASQGMSPVLE